MESLLQPLVDLLYAVLKFFHNTLQFNWGWSIVMLTVVVRLVLFPLTYRQYKSMRAMQLLQPKIKELQEKYKGDRELLNQKLAEFYKENKFNPLSSCLPLLLQMPVFFALFYMLRGQSFPGDNHWLWIGAFSDAPAWLQIAQDITQFDLPLVIVYIVSQFVSSLIMAGKDPTQRAMMYIMPITIGVITYVGKWPAGLLLYWSTSNIWTIGQQYVIMRLVKAPEPVAAAEGKGGSESGAKAISGAKTISGGKAAGQKRRKKKGGKG